MMMHRRVRRHRRMEWSSDGVDQEQAIVMEEQRSSQGDSAVIGCQRADSAVSMVTGSMGKPPKLS